MWYDLYIYRSLGVKGLRSTVGWDATGKEFSIYNVITVTGVPFIVSMGSAKLSHTKRAFAATSSDSSRAQVHDIGGHSV